MKQITNWRRATVFDIEANNLLDEATEIHVLGYNMLGKTGALKGRTEAERIKKFFQHHIDSKIPVVVHNGIGYDIPLVEKVYGVDLSKLMVCDSLSLSWYLNTDRQLHGLDSFFTDYGIAKPKIGNHRWAAPIKQSWNTEKGHLTRLERHYSIMEHRVTQDVRINVALWEDFKERLTDLYANVKRCVDGGLVDGKRMSEDEVCYIDQYKQSSTVDEYIDRILTFLMFKADCARLKEKTKFKVDVEKLDCLIDSLGTTIEDAKAELESVMPQVPQYTEKNRPAKPYKKNGELSVSGLSWQETVARVGEKDESGNIVVEQIDLDTIRILKSYDPPNINGHQQIKDFLFSKGWVPQNFKFVKDEKAQQAWADGGFRPHQKPKPRAIPQVSIDGDDGKELCPSVVELAERVPEIMAYAKYTTIKHRLDMCKGFKESLREGGYLCARVGGYTNTLREKHREIVNIPSLAKPYGKDIRDIFIAGKGNILLGSDLSSLEDKVKHMFMLPHDFDYVQTMSQKGYDPHLAIAVMAGLMTEDEMAEYKYLKSLGDDKNAEQVKRFELLGKIRQTGKQGNYSCQYGAGADTFARASGVSLGVAKKVVEGYAKLNWAIKAIADEQCVITDSSDKMWLVNPINGFAYSLRGDKDKFSTLCQGTGSYFFDIWVSRILDGMYAKWKVKRLTCECHDDFVQCFKDTEDNREAMKEITLNSLVTINKDYKLRKELTCDIHYGEKYSDIH